MAGRKRKGEPRIRRRVKVCGSKGCQVVNAVVDTGASMSAMTERLARKIGVLNTAGNGTMHTAGGITKAWGGAARICMKDRGCGCLSGQVAVLPVPSFGDTELLVGQDYLEASGAIIDAQGRTIRCRMRRRSR